MNQTSRITGMKKCRGQKKLLQGSVINENTDTKDWIKQFLLKFEQIGFYDPV